MIVIVTIVIVMTELLVKEITAETIQEEVSHVVYSQSLDVITEGTKAADVAATN